MRKVVAIDGPSGVGKSTVARGVARELGFAVLDTGAMYRVVTLAALERDTDLDDGEALAAVARQLTFDVSGPVMLDGRDVSAAIRGPAVTDAVSRVSAHPPVRAVLVERQRGWVGEHGGGVVEGRDIGTVVFPDAVVKVFLSADAHVRAERRQQDELLAARPAPLDAVEQDLGRRDRADSTLGRALNPDQAAPDAIVIDTSSSDAGDVVARVVACYRERVAT